MLLIDIDRFKDVNDRHRYIVGDEVIRQIGMIIRGSLREGDVAGRYGGDEFGLVLCNTDVQAASRVAERIRTEVVRSLAGCLPGLQCTLSIGLASGSAGLGSVREWLEAADAALYRATGRPQPVGRGGLSTCCAAAALPGGTRYRCYHG